MKIVLIADGFWQRRKYLTSYIKYIIDLLFYAVERRYPNHICVRFYKNATSGAGKTQQSVQITLLSRLQKFEISSLAAMMSQDELELSTLADKPSVLYMIIPDNDTSYNFIISLLYIQLFQALYDKADNVYKGRLPRLVHVIMDEFANALWLVSSSLSSILPARIKFKR